MSSDGGFQFFREEAYAIVRGQGRPTTKTGRPSRGVNRSAVKASASEVIGEAVRAEGDHPHVSKPQPPRVLHWIAADELADYWTQVEDLAKQQKVAMADGKQRRQRSDTPILIGAIATYPGRANDDDAEYVRWRELAVAFMKRRYGERILSIIEHVDEKHGHLHCLVADKGRPVKALMAGHGAQLEAESAGKSKKEAAQAYADASRALQDAFYDEVGMPAGLTRQGPGKRHLPRAAWNAERAQARSVARALARKEAEERELDARAAEIRAQQARNAAEKKQLREAVLALESERRALAKREREVEQLVAAMTPEQEAAAAERYEKARKAEPKPAVEPLVHNADPVPAPAGRFKRPTTR